MEKQRLAFKKYKKKKRKKKKLNVYTEVAATIKAKFVEFCVVKKMGIGNKENFKKKNSRNTKRKRTRFYK